MNYLKRQDLNRQFRVEIFKGTQIIDNESYDFVSSKQFFPNPQEAAKYIEELKSKLEESWVIRYFQKVEEEWSLLEIIEA